MFKKNPRRAFRQRRESSSEEEEEDRGGGDEEEVKKASRPAQSRGITCQSKREETPPKADSSDGEDGDSEEEEPGGGERSHGGEKKTKSILSFSDDKEGEESTFKVKKCSDRAVLFQARKKETSPNQARQSSAGRRVTPSASPWRDDDSPASPRDDDDDDNSDSDEDDARSLSVSSDSSHSAVKPVVIPNAEQIKAAKRQRHATRTQKDFISLKSSGRTLDHYGREDEDREGGDDDDDDDDERDDHEARIQFAPRLKSIRERIAEKLGDSDGSLSLSDGEEQELWEELQIEKGVKRRPGGQSPSGSESSSYSCDGRTDGRTDGRRLKKRSTGVHVPKLPPVTVSMVRKRITGKLDSLKEVHRARQAELRRMENDVECARTSLESLEESSSENRLKFYRNTTLYIHNLVECLREKVMEVNSLELELHCVLSEHQEDESERRRRRVREQQLSCNTEQNENSSNGKTTDEAEESQSSADQELHKKTTDLLLRSRSVFSDVQDEFYDVKKVLSRFDEWRTFHSDSYHDAYISLCLPKLLNPIIRHQLLAWSPLEDSVEDLENLPWFSAVETFCHGHGHQELEQEDRRTLRDIMEKTVLPKITALVDLVWDPLSSRQSSCVSAVCHQLRDDYDIFDGESSKHVKALREAVIRRLRSCVDEDVFIPLFPKHCLEDESSPQRRFRDQQFRTAVQLLGIMGKWDQLLPESVLKELMLDKLLNRYLMISLSQTLISSNDITQIADSLPESWFRRVESCLLQLHGFRDFLVQRVHAVCREQPPQDQSTRAVVVPLLQVLSRIRCNENIMEIAERYHYQDLVYTHQLINQENS